MKILLCHNFYQNPGGEDQVFADERRLLESRGHEVVCFTRHNDDLRGLSHWLAARNAIWNCKTYDDVRDLIRRTQPDVMHCTNTFPLISPAIYYAAREQGVTVVQSLHNFRLFCPNGLFLRGHRVCEDCLGKCLAWPSVLHGCYRGSRAASAVVAAMLAVHRARGTWQTAVDRYIALTGFGRDKFVAAGLPADKIAVKPNFVDPDPCEGSGSGGYAVFLGRLVAEKGIRTLVAAWQQLGDIPLKIVGDGPLADEVRLFAAENPAVEWLGYRTPAEVGPILGKAVCLVMPSIWYEVMPKTLVESLAKGTPIVASRRGSMAELVRPEKTGLLFEPGNTTDLASQVRRMFTDAGLCARMRQDARREYLTKYTAEENYTMLMSIYESASQGRAEINETRQNGACFA